jgi:riboflavin-specific deaminase-like protein
MIQCWNEQQLLAFTRQIEDWLNQRILKGIRQDRPFVTLSYAQSLDACITSKSGEAIKLSNPSSTRLTHLLRSLHDGILVGIGTVLSDDPLLNVREWHGVSPQPVILDSNLRIPAFARLSQDPSRTCWLLTCSDGEAPAKNYNIIKTERNHNNQVDLPEALAHLRRSGIRSLMVEGGSQVITAFLQAKLVDAIVLTISPVIIGGYKSVGTLDAGIEFPKIEQFGSQMLENNLIVWGDLNYGQGQA